MTRLRWALVDGWTITLRDLSHVTRQPFAFAVNLLFPVLILLMFVYLFGGGMAVPDGASYRDFLVPGMFALTMFFGIESTVTSVITDAARGITDRFRSMPIAGSAVVLGRNGADLVGAAATLAVMLVCGLAIGWRWHGSVADAALALLLLLWLRFAVLWLGIYLGLVMKNPASVVAVQILVWPIGFLSNVYTSPATMPGWLGALADWNPVSATAGAVRQLFGNPVWTPDSWAAQHPVLLAVAWPAVLVAIFLPLSVRAYRNLRTG
jgi:ABC-2 type transport system permease protein